MARTNICGFELGALETMSTSGSWLKVTTPVRTGTYSLRAHPTTTGTMFADITAATDAIGNEAAITGATYSRFYFRYALKPATGREAIFKVVSGSAPTNKFSLFLLAGGTIDAYDSAGTKIGTGATVLSQDTWYRIEVQCGNGTSVAWEVRIDGTTEHSGTANLGAVSTLNITLGKYVDTNGNTVDFFYDDISIDDATWCGAGEVKPLSPTGVGQVDTWTLGAGSTKTAAVSEATPDAGTSYVVTSTNTNAQTFAVTDSASAIGGGIQGTIAAVKMYVYVSQQNTALAWGGRVYSGSAGTTATNWTTASTGSLSWFMRGKCYAVDPADSAAWTTGRVDLVEAGAVHAQSQARALWMSWVGVMVESAGGSSPNATVTPSALATTGTLSDVTDMQGSTFSPGAVSGTGSLPASIHVTQPSPSALAGTGSLPVVSLQVGSTFSVLAVAGTGSLPAATAITATTVLVTPGVIAGTGTVPAQSHTTMLGPSALATTGTLPAMTAEAFPSTDHFTDTAGTDLASHVPDSGGTWTLHPTSSGAQVVVTDANRLRSNISNTVVDAIYTHSAAPLSADYDVACDLHCFSNPTTDAAGPVGRVNPTTADYYLARYRSNQGFQIYKFVGGSATQLGSTYARILTAGEDANLTLRMSGSSISLLVDGVVQVGPITDTSTSAAGLAGVFLTSNPAATNTTCTHVDNFTAKFSVTVLTVSPGTLAGTGTIPSVLISVGDLLQPAAVIGTGSIPTATIFVGSTLAPSAVTGTGSLPAQSHMTTLAPGTVAGTGSLPVAVDMGGVTESPLAVTGTGSIPATAQTILLGLSAVTGTGSLPIAADMVGVTESPTSVIGTGSIPAQSHTTMLTPSVITTTGTLPVAVDMVGVTESPLAVIGTGSLPTASELVGVTESPPAVIGTGSVPTAAIFVGSTLAPSAVTGTGSLPAAAQTIMLGPSAVIGTGTLPAVSLQVGSTFAVLAVVGTGSLGAATALTASTVLVTPGVITGTGSIPTATIFVGSTSTPSAMTGTGSLPNLTHTTMLGPSAVAGTGTLPVAADMGGVTESPVAVIGTGSLPTPDHTTLLGPSAVAGTGSLPTLTHTTTLAPGVVIGTGNLPTTAQTILLGPSALAGTGTLPVAADLVGVTESPLAVIGTGSLPAQSHTTLLGPSSLVGTGTLPSPSLQVGSTIAVVALAGTGSLGAVFVTTVNTTRVTPIAIAGTGTLPNITVSISDLMKPAALAAAGTLGATSQTLRTSPTAVAGTGTIPTAALLVGYTISTAVITGTGSLPTVTTKVGVSLSPGAVAGTGTVPTATYAIALTRAPQAIAAAAALGAVIVTATAPGGFPSFETPIDSQFIASTDPFAADPGAAQFLPVSAFPAADPFGAKFLSSSEFTSADAQKAG